MADPLPMYSPSVPSPIYSTAPGSNERVLQRTPLPGYSRLTGTFIRNEHIITVVVDGQKENSCRPCFGRGALLSGTVLLESYESVTAVNIKLEGILESLGPSHGYSSLKVVDKTSSLYVQDGSQRRCPSAIPFSLRFPPTFKNKGVQYPLPPSCDIALPRGSFLKCTYSLTVGVITALHRSISFLTKEKSLSIELEYRQRTRPSRPRIIEASLFSTIVTCPEEWLQLPVALTVGPDLPMHQLSCLQLFVPSVGVFGIAEIVPFHLQLSGSIQSIRELLLQSNPEQGMHSQTIRVYLLRQIKVDAIGKGTTKMNTILREGLPRSLPPAFSDHPPSHSSTFKKTRLTGKVNYSSRISPLLLSTPAPSG
ncbi:hypothetical protein C8R44DRAFT_931618 [Mycena epipterygia]|nr:hypothetical protein C8R44DRAFT_931618 [Mycena epipterygia]